MAAIIAICVGLGAAILILVAYRFTSHNNSDTPRNRNRNGYLEQQIRQTVQNTYRRRPGGDNGPETDRRRSGGDNGPETDRRRSGANNAPETERRRTPPSLPLPAVVSPLTSLDLSDFGNSGTHHRDLRSLLDQIASAGSFSAVFVSDDEGRPLAFTRTQKNLERLAATSTRLMSVATQSCNEGSGPLAIMLRDSSGMTMLCRIFKARGQELSLTVVGEEVLLTPLTLDQAVDKIEEVLTSPWREGSEARKSEITFDDP
ncbi:MAG: hypothetical protein FWD68_15445 [Alphaproteobacteria bacterium]|nr:hypothetical protein [Alphaproteobacteria bacterium]